MLTWRIYYDDGSTFDSDQGEPWDAPGLGVALILQRREGEGRLVMHRWDWYVWRCDLGEWWGHDLFGLLDQLTDDRAGVVRAVKAGRMLSTPDWNALYTRAIEDADFPVQVAREVSDSPKAQR